jgi:hypothetical protein
MKELTAAFQSEVFYPIATLVVPGFFAISTLAFAALQRLPIINELAEQHPGVATATAVLTVLTSGLVCEDLGAHLEQRFDGWLENEAGYEEHQNEWFLYLRMAFDKEPVGQHYLNTLVLRLKFELGMTFASIAFAGGALLIQIPCLWRIGIICFALLAFAFFGREAKSSHKSLSLLRRELLKGRWEPTRKTP